MPSFASPHQRYQQSFLGSVQEIIDAGEGEHWTGLTGTPRPEGKVPETILWWVDGEEYLGRL
jgi:hypothetical protein